MNRLQIEAGWCAVLRIPATENDTKTAVNLLEEVGVAIHSGGFFRFSGLRMDGDESTVTAQRIYVWNQSLELNIFNDCMSIEEEVLSS